MLQTWSLQLAEILVFFSFFFFGGGGGGGGSYITSVVLAEAGRSEDGH